MNQPPPLNPVWYYAHEGETFGPFSRAELSQKAEEGIVKPETLVMKQGDTDWQPFASCAAPISADSGSSAVQMPVPAGAQNEQPKQQEGCKQGCIGCLGLLIICMFFGFIFNTCSKQNLTLSDAERNNPTEAVQKLMKAVYGSRLREADCNETDAGSVAGGKLMVRVRVNEGGHSSSNAVSLMEYDMEKAFKALYQSGLPIFEVTIWNYATMVDRYGKTSDDVVYKVGLLGSEAARIDWEHVNLKRIWEVKSLHPSLR